MDFFKYEGIQHFFTKKKIFKFRYIFRFNLMKEIFQNITKIRTSHSKSYPSSFGEKDISKLFSFNLMDQETNEKLKCFLDLYLKNLKSNICFYCFLKGDILCSKCGVVYYCSMHHQEQEWNIFHFFDCNIIKMCKEVLQFGIHNCTSKGEIN